MRTPSGGRGEDLLQRTIDDMDFAELARLTGQDGAFDQPHRSFHQRAETTDAALNTRLDELAKLVIAAKPRIRTSPKLAPNVRLVALNLYAARRVDIRLSVALPMGS